MRTIFLTAGLLAAISTLSPRDAEACGGCFHEPPLPTAADASTTQTGSVVTDHRMALAITSQGTTLWDQIEYVGDPGEFVWVLPIQGEVVVAVGSDAFLDALDNRTAPQISGPIVYCKPPPQPAGGGGGSAFTGGNSSDGLGCGCGSQSMSDEAMSAAVDSGASSDDAAGFAPDEGVVVTHREAVGPYETVQIKGDGTESILAWLRKNGFDVPMSIEPMVQKYVDEKFGFLAVRLKPGAGVQAMKPIRVSWKGKTPQLPLRMVAAGVGTSVGLKLFVIGDGRWRTKNFDTFTIDPGNLTWDFLTSRSTYTTERDALAKAKDGRAWALESSIEMYGSGLPTTDPDPIVDSGTSETASDAAVDSGDAESDAGDAASELPPIPPSANDVDVAFPDEGPHRVTRLRADLPAKWLDVDLELEADDDQSIKPVDYHVSKYRNAEGLCTYGIAYVSGVAVEGPGAAASAPAASSCAVGDAEKPIRVSLFGLGALAVLGLLRRVRR
ncbi:MAG: DUF2330 domain-containing protein [Polyangiales bacterium]